jgi:RNA polymerase sigma-70 factor (ECF subfamily)
MGAAATEADDAAQDAFLAAFEAIAEFRGEGTFAGWVKRIAVRQYLRRLQKERRAANWAAEGLEPEEPHAPDEGIRLDLDQAIQGLSHAERLCVSMCYGAGLSHGEAAEALNLPLGTVKSHVKRGLEKLRARLAPAIDASERRGHG